MSIYAIHRYVGFLCLGLAALAFFIGYLNNSLAYGFVYLLRLIGLYLPFYCLMCIKRGDERILSSNWGSSVITKDNHPIRFWLAIAVLMFFASSCWVSWVTIQVY
jgi:hypothetical protein